MTIPASINLQKWISGFQPSIARKEKKEKTEDIFNNIVVLPWIETEEAPYVYMYLCRSFWHLQKCGICGLRIYPATVPNIVKWLKNMISNRAESLTVIDVCKIEEDDVDETLKNWQDALKQVKIWEYPNYLIVFMDSTLAPNLKLKPFYNHKVIWTPGEKKEIAEFFKEGVSALPKPGFAFRKNLDFVSCEEIKEGDKKYPIVEIQQQEEKQKQFPVPEVSTSITTCLKQYLNPFFKETKYDLGDLRTTEVPESALQAFAKMANQISEVPEELKENVCIKAISRDMLALSSGCRIVVLVNLVTHQIVIPDTRILGEIERLKCSLKRIEDRLEEALATGKLGKGKRKLDKQSESSNETKSRTKTKRITKPRLENVKGPWNLVPIWENKAGGVPLNRVLKLQKTLNAYGNKKLEFMSIENVLTQNYIRLNFKFEENESQSFQLTFNFCNSKQIMLKICKLMDPEDKLDSSKYILLDSS
jgi:hypothetical protein